jgi:hypothetical protein
MKDDVIVKADTRTNTITIRGKKYKVHSERKPRLSGHSGDIVLRPINEEAYENRIAKAATCLVGNASYLNVDMILQEALRQVPLKAFEKIEAKIAKKKRPKLEKGCLNLSFGKDCSLQIV